MIGYFIGKSGKSCNVASSIDFKEFPLHVASSRKGRADCLNDSLHVNVFEWQCPAPIDATKNVVPLTHIPHARAPRFTHTHAHTRTYTHIQRVIHCPLHHAVEDAAQPREADGGSRHVQVHRPCGHLHGPVRLWHDGWCALLPSAMWCFGEARWHPPFTAPCFEPTLHSQCRRTTS